MEAHMDIDLEIECGHCGCLYKEGFMGMHHGRMLKCPFCMSTDLAIVNDTLVEDNSAIEMHEVPVHDAYFDSKFKV